MRNGIYRIEVSWPDMKCCGVAAIRAETFRGVDRDCAYVYNEVTPATLRILTSFKDDRVCLRTLSVMVKPREHPLTPADDASGSSVESVMDQQ
jgi:hypothetical protein